MKDNVRQDEFIPVTRNIIKNVLEAVGMTAPKFAEALGINYQRIFDLQRGRTKKFNPNIAALICEKFPQINKSYLFTGEGSVLVETEDAVPVEHVPAEPASDGGGLAEISALLHRLVDMLDQVNERSARLTDFERQLRLLLMPANWTSSNARTNSEWLIKKRYDISSVALSQHLSKKTQRCAQT